MKGNLMRLLLAIAVASLSACALPAGPYSNTRWGFASRFPYSINEKSGPGEGITVSAANDADTIAYMLSVFPISGATLARKGPDRALEDAVRGAVDNVHGTLLSKRDITLAGFPGKQFEIVAKGMLAECRLYLVGERMYLPMVIAAHDVSLPMTVDAFHAAFTLIDPPAAAPAQAAAPAPKVVAQFIFDNERLEHPNPHLPREWLLAHPDAERVSALYRICVGTDGHIDKILVMRGIDGADDAIIEQVTRTWRYRPQPVPICSPRAFTFVISPPTVAPAPDEAAPQP
jgi:hypothetical protein